MQFELMGISASLMQKRIVDEIEKCNDTTSKYGLTLSHSQAIELYNTRTNSLKNSGRIEFGGGIVPKIIDEFCDSPYVCGENYTQILNDLVEMFYTYKNETLDLIGDDDLIRFIKNKFNGVCAGSIQILEDSELPRLIYNLQHGYPADCEDDNQPDCEDDCDNDEWS